MYNMLCTIVVFAVFKWINSSLKVFHQHARPSTSSVM